MRLPALACLLAAAALSGCAVSAPVVAEAPPSPPPPRPVYIPPPPPPVAVVVPEAPPPPPPAAPRGTVATRTHYARADVTEWILTNGATVVFKPLPNEGTVDLVAFERASESATEAARDVGDRRLSADLAVLFEAPLFESDPSGQVPAGVRAGASRATYILVGDARPGDVEAAAARVLVAGAGSTFQPVLGPSIRPGAGYRVSAPPESDAAFEVLAELLTARAGPAQPAYERAFAERDARAGTATLWNGPDAARLARLDPTPAELADARARVARTRPSDVGFWARALADLYHTTGDIRPARDPAFVADFAARVARVSARDVADLAARLAASPVLN